MTQLPRIRPNAASTRGAEGKANACRSAIEETSGRAAERMLRLRHRAVRRAASARRRGGRRSSRAGAGRPARRDRGAGETDLTHPLGQPEDLRAHQQLLDGAATEVPVLPFRFGAVMTDAQAVAEELLAPHEQEFAAALEELDGRAEYVIKGRYAEHAVLREVLAENPQAARLREQIGRIRNEAATRYLRIQLGQLINQAVSAKRVADTRALRDVLAGHVAASSVREATHEIDAAYVAVLAETAHQDELENAISQLARD
jgi:hypothetical protein